MLIELYMKILIGNTGLVGQTLKETIKFDLEFNSKNISDFGNHNIDGSELWLSCLPATKWMVNKNIKSDIENIMSIINTISKFKYSKIILISTIDVYTNSPSKVSENYPINFDKLNYGSNRYLFEKLILEFIEFDDLKIFRLPSLFNKKIKKNILFDLLNNNNIELININSSFQWYNLDRLSLDIEKCISEFPEEITFNLFTEPIETKEIVNLFPNMIDKVTYKGDRIDYNFTTKFNKLEYILTKEEVLNDIRKFINEYISK